MGGKAGILVLIVALAGCDTILAGDLPDGAVNGPPGGPVDVGGPDVGAGADGTTPGGPADVGGADVGTQDAPQVVDASDAATVDQATVQPPVTDGACVDSGPVLDVDVPPSVWAVSPVNTGADKVHGISVDSAGNSHITGIFYDTLTFGPTTLTANNGPNLYVAKLDSAGNWLWAVFADIDAFSGTAINPEARGGIAVDSAGNSYIAGGFQGTASFGAVPSKNPIQLTAEGWTDAFVAKLDSAGNWLWATSAGRTWETRALAISVDSAGNSYVTGAFNGMAAFGDTTLKNSSSFGSGALFVAKLDSAGNWLWAVQSSSDDITGQGISVDSAGNSYVTGEIDGKATLGSITVSTGGFHQVFVVKLDSAGNWLWAANTNVPGWAGPGGISVDNAGNAYVTGYLEGQVFFGPIAVNPIGTAGASDVFVAKLDSAGNWVWVTSAGGGGKQDALRGTGIWVDGAGNSHVTGTVLGTAILGSTMVTSNGASDVFVAKLDSAGNWLWALAGGGTGMDHAQGVSVDGTGNSYVAGDFEGTATFGSTTLSSSATGVWSDSFVWKVGGK